MSSQHTAELPRLAEVVGALSLATDLGMGQPLEFALSSCLLGLRLGDTLGWGDEALREIYYQALLRYIGCNVDGHLLAAIAGDEIAVRGEFALVDNGKTSEVLGVMTRGILRAHYGAAPLDLARELLSGLRALPAVPASFAGHCEVAQRLATRLNLAPAMIVALGQLYERWDGKGTPRGLKGDAIAPAVLVVTLAQDALIHHRLGGVEAAVTVARTRSGGAYAPYVAECFIRHAPQLFAGLEIDAAWETVLQLEPGEQRRLTAAEFDEACQAMADFVDIKSPFTLNHSSGVAQLAANAARQGGLPAADCTALERAGLLHDIGCTGISAGIWQKAGALSSHEWERVRLHPYYSERILAQSPALARLGAIAGLHHERLDGSGYHRGLTGPQLSPAARILAAADVYQALLEARPHRPAFADDEAAAILQRETRAGRLDAQAVSCVLAGAGQRIPKAKRDLTAGLSDREVEVLRLLAGGLSTRAIAEQLIISPKTADHHIQHIYAKIGVSTRAGATLFAMEHDLLE